MYRTYGHLLKRRCRRILRDPEKVEDVMQEIFLTLCRSLDQYEGKPDQILPWLYRVTTTHCLRLLDKDKRGLRGLTLHQEDSLVEHAAPISEWTKEEQLALTDFLETLPEDQRAVVLYRYVSGMTQEEIAEVMDVSRDQVRRWLQHFQQRGRIVLRENIR
ncbi:MAG: sigma-70 family RNA polymerase sigma factor [Myxococcales bacterium]|nr:sigma-70 family RNA polymerase sigma factor [Myxococcales bacterium]